MPNKSVFCIAHSVSHAELLVDRLKLEGFTNDDISVLLPDKDSSRDLAHEKHTKAPEGAVVGVSTGSAVGGAIGWIAGIGALILPGAGPFIAAGPIVAALSGAAIGGAMGAVAGALIGFGIPEFEARRYEGKVADGNILISVHTYNGEQIAKAKGSLIKGGAHDVCTTGEADVPRGTTRMEHTRITAELIS